MPRSSGSKIDPLTMLALREGGKNMQPLLMMALLDKQTTTTPLTMLALMQQAGAGMNRDALLAFAMNPKKVSKKAVENYMVLHMQGLI